MTKNGSERKTDLKEILNAVDPNNHADMIATLQEIVIELDKVLTQQHKRMLHMVSSSNNNTEYFIGIFKSLGVEFFNASEEKEKLN
jgi:hypothetical protein